MDSKTKVFFLFTIIFGSCSKNYTPPPTGSTPVSFITTHYDSLSTHNSQGVPNNLGVPDSITTGLTKFIDTSLHSYMDLTKSRSDLFVSSASANIDFSANTNVSVTFVFQKGYFRNTIGFYTYPTAKPPTKPQDIATITYIFPNATPIYQGGGLPLGSKVSLGTFKPGTSMGFVLLQNAWSDTTHSVKTNTPHYLSSDVLNPENDPNKKRHVILLHYLDKTLICFEDQDRAAISDNDFNDEIIYTTQTPSP
jgi:hypothetical protein